MLGPQKIQQKIILSAPFGELQKVAKSLKNLTFLNPSNDPWFDPAVEKYNQDHLSILSDNKGTCLIMTQNKVNKTNNQQKQFQPSQYINQNNGLIYKLENPVNLLNFTKTKIQVKLKPQSKKLLECLTSEMESYVKKCYKSPNGSQTHIEANEEGMNVFVGVSCKNLDISEHYVGEWISKWKINSCEIVGNITIRVNFDQQGKVEFNQHRQVKQKFQWSDDMGMSAKEIAKIIKKLESQVQQDLSLVYDSMKEKYFKKLRRIAPLTQTKMQWTLNSTGGKQYLPQLYDL